MTHHSNDQDPWAALPAEAALRRVQHSITPGWEAWTVPLWGGGTVWCARRLADGALTRGDHPARLLEHIAHADEDLAHKQRAGHNAPCDGPHHHICATSNVPKGNNSHE